MLTLARGDDRRPRDAAWLVVVDCVVDAVDLFVVDAIVAADDDDDVVVVAAEDDDDEVTVVAVNAADAVVVPVVGSGGGLGDAVGYCKADDDVVGAAVAETNSDYCYHSKRSFDDAVVVVT